MQLPEPHYHPDAKDPAWLRFAVQFHGHLGPWATAGLRLGAAAREAVAAPGYFGLTVTCHGPLEQPPRSCFIDGVQVATGATWGKRNLQWKPGEELAVELTSTETDRSVRVRPSGRLLELLGSMKPSGGAPAGDADHTARLEAIAREIATAPAEEMLTVDEVT